jgi:hypothetical protein
MHLGFLSGMFSILSCVFPFSSYHSVHNSDVFWSKGTDPMLATAEMSDPSIKATVTQI